MFWMNRFAHASISKWIKSRWRPITQCDAIKRAPNFFNKQIAKPIEKMHRSKSMHKIITMGGLLTSSYVFLNSQTPVFTAESQDRRKEKLFQLIHEDLEKIEFVTGKDIVLLIGTEGEEKSALVNYLLGGNMETVVKSKGLELGVYKRNGYVYVDCPMTPNTIWTKLSIQLILKKANSIKILLVVDQEKVTHSVALWCEMYKFLDFFFKNTSKLDLSHSLSLVITNTEKLKLPPDRKKIAKDIQTTIDRLKEDEKVGKIDKMHNIKLQGLNLIDKAKIIITNFSEVQRKTEKNINDNVELSSPLKDIVPSFPSTFSEWVNDAMIHDVVVKGDQLLSKQRVLSPNQHDNILQVDPAIAQLESEISRKNVEIIELEQTAEEETVLGIHPFKSEEIRGWMDLFRRHLKTIDYKIAYPFTNISIVKNDDSAFINKEGFIQDLVGDGHVEVVQSKSDAGEYSVKYKRSFCRDVDARIKILGKRRCSKEYIEKMKVLIAERSKLQTDKTQKVQECLEIVTKDIEQQWSMFVAIRKVVNLWGDYEQIDSVFKSFFEKITNPETYILHADQLYKMGCHAEALKSYEWAMDKMEYDENNYRILYERMGDCFNALKLFNEADSRYEEALKGSEPNEKTELYKKRLAILKIDPFASRKIKLIYFYPFVLTIRKMMSRAPDQWVDPQILSKLNHCKIEDEDLIVQNGKDVNIVKLKHALAETKNAKFIMNDDAINRLTVYTSTAGIGALVWGFSSLIAHSLSTSISAQQAVGLGAAIGSVAAYNRSKQQSKQKRQGLPPEYLNKYLDELHIAVKLPPKK